MPILCEFFTMFLFRSLRMLENNNNTMASYAHAQSCHESLVSIVIDPGLSFNCQEPSTHGDKLLYQRYKNQIMPIWSQLSSCLDLWECWRRLRLRPIALTHWGWSWAPAGRPSDRSAMGFLFLASTLNINSPVARSRWPVTISAIILVNTFQTVMHVFYIDKTIWPLV